MFLQFGVFCQNNEYSQGCVIDAIRINRTSYAATTKPPTTTTTTTAATTSTTTTAAPGGPDIEWSFSDSTAGWSLGRSNGASWQRLDTNFPEESPLNDFSLQVIPSDIYSSELNFKKLCKKEVLFPKVPS